MPQLFRPLFFLAVMVAALAALAGCERSAPVSEAVPEIVPENAASLSPAELDARYAYPGELGVVFDGDVPSLKVWAPTASGVEVSLFDSATAPEPSQTLAMTLDENTGVWTATGNSGWKGMYYLYTVDVDTRNVVTDPYSVSLSMDSQRSQIIDLDDPQWKPQGWDELTVTVPERMNDVVLYELHVRDFSMADATVSPEARGKFRAFTQAESNGMQHLKRLADAGVTHVHLLPVFDIASVIEDESKRQEPDIPESIKPSSRVPAEAVHKTRDLDGFNWGYDPFHFGVPEGSYAENPAGGSRTLEFREMVQALNDIGLAVVMDVVYNHTHASGTDPFSVLDQVVPGYYQRLDPEGNVYTSTCCQNTATEHRMMEKLMIDTLVRFAVDYKVAGFRFDLMGHHTKENMLNVRAALDALTLEEHGVDGTQIFLYGEGWDFGEVANNALFVNATQVNMAGTDIGTFNDRQRDAMRGGGYASGYRQQGYISADDHSSDILLGYADLVRLGMAGTQQEYLLVNKDGERTAGRDFSYSDSPMAAYGLGPLDVINYASAHDNETLFDIIQIKAGDDADLDERIRMQNLGTGIVALSQGIPFFHAGVEILRSKGMDRNSFNSGDWFNVLDLSYQHNNWGRGLPPAEENSPNYELMTALLENPELMPSEQQIRGALAFFQEAIRIRRSSPLFRLDSTEEIQRRVSFHNTGPEQVPGLIVMRLSDEADGLESIDDNFSQILVVVNAASVDREFADPDAPWASSGADLQLHPCQADSFDEVVRTARSENGGLSVPARTLAVFVELTDQGSAVCP